MDDLELPEVAEDVLAGVAVIAASVLVRTALGKLWERRTERPPPRNPAAPGVSWREALLWASLVGVAAGIAKVITRRLLARPRAA